MNTLVDIDPISGALQPRDRTIRGQQLKLYFRINTHRNSFFPSAILLWNSVPPAVKTAASLGASKSKLGVWAEAVS